MQFDPIVLSLSGQSIAGKTFSLTCSATLISPTPLPSNVPLPSFEWFFGPHGNTSLHSGVTPTATLKNCFTYSSTLQFSPTLKESHAGNYTCRLGAGRRLANSIEISVDGMSANTRDDLAAIYNIKGLILPLNNCSSANNYCLCSRKINTKLIQTALQD